MKMEDVIHDEVLKWKQFGLFKLEMIQSFADACYNAYMSLEADGLNGPVRDHTFFAILVDDVAHDERVSVQFNYRIDSKMQLALVSLTCAITGVMKPLFFSCVSQLPSYHSIVASFFQPPVVGDQQNDLV